MAMNKSNKDKETLYTYKGELGTILELGVTKQENGVEFLTLNMDCDHDWVFTIWMDATDFCNHFNIQGLPNWDVDYSDTYGTEESFSDLIHKMYNLKGRISGIYNSDVKMGITAIQMLEKPIEIIYKSIDNYLNNCIKRVGI